MREDGWFRAGRAMPPPAGETTPNPLEGYAVVLGISSPVAFDFPALVFLVRFWRLSVFNYII
jgi:hypothetical protein